MEIQRKIEILAEAAKYDVSCSSSGSTRKNRDGGLGNSAPAGICHSWTSDGRCVSLLKLLLSNDCIYDCAYCINRATNDRPRASFTPKQVADLTINFYRRNYIEGLFLSSAIFINPDNTMEKLLKTLSILRNSYNFNGYIHVKAIPGADYRLIYQAGQLADRMSVNIELPSRDSLQNLAPQKKPVDILKPMEQIGTGIKANQEERKKFKSAPNFVPAGHSTQLIVGASPEKDYQILKLSEGLYDKFNLKRVYYSAFMPVKPDSRLPAIPGPPLLREHRLYQADWLLRFYNFEAEELLNQNRPDFNLKHDPKMDWALNNLDKFPVEINKADYWKLVRIPGIGPTSAKRIISARKEARLNIDNLNKLGPVIKRARYFILCDGKYIAGIPFKPDLIKARISAQEQNNDYHQLNLFSSLNKTGISQGDTVDKMELLG
ncbi:MAG: putative DNA modification/repair radical SAM protein [Bacillota bacterium]